MSFFTTSSSFSLGFFPIFTVFLALGWTIFVLGFVYMGMALRLDLEAAENKNQTRSEQRLNTIWRIGLYALLIVNPVWFVMLFKLMLATFWTSHTIPLVYFALGWIMFMLGLGFNMLALRFGLGRIGLYGLLALNLLWFFMLISSMVAMGAA